MDNVTLFLPPFSPDYSGICSAFYDLDGLLVIHDASGCTGNYTGFDEPRWADRPEKVYCSGLREMDAVMGDDQKLIAKVSQALQDLKPQFVAVLGSPVPMVIGSDMKGIAHEIAVSTGVPAFGFDTTGLEYYDKGIVTAYKALVDAYIKHDAIRKEIPGTINLLGLTPLDYGREDIIKPLVDKIEERGWSVQSTWSAGLNLEKVTDSIHASMNLVLSVSALPLARYFSQKWGIPYAVGFPVGHTGDIFLNRLLGKTNNENEVIGKWLNNVDETQKKQKVLVIGEQIFANGMRASLMDDFSFTDVTVSSFFMMDKEAALEKDFHIRSEAQLMDLLTKRQYTTIVADPLIEDAFCHLEGLTWIGLPHAAVSSRQYWRKPLPLWGAEYIKFIEESVICK